MKVALGSDHAGFAMKGALGAILESWGHEVDDLGAYSEESVDYPDFAAKVGRGVAAGDYEAGILICGTGLGMTIAANKIKGVRAVVAHDTFSARMSRAHNNANVLALGARVIGEGLAEEIVKVWLSTEFEGGRHQRRVDKLTRLEG
ncbi:MAG: ribose 5-phosphate isomerase B [Firmicutes bacterium]|nr:ribose 5-phosphate isomerase B [Bacillota bacterium]